jgi:L-threonylcarbamoyladenylate synthase
LIVHRISPDVPDEALILSACDVLRSGGVVAYPTDTLYGLGVDPRRADAVERLYAAKGRDASVAIPLIAASIEQAREVAILGELEMRLARAFWPGPLTLVMPARPVLTAALLAGGSTVAIRVPSHAVARELCRVFGFPLTATSANRSGEQPAASGHEVIASFVSEIDLLLDAGAAPGGPPSTIVEIATSGPRLVRSGAVPWNRVLESLE